MGDFGGDRDTLFYECKFVITLNLFELAPFEKSYNRHCIQIPLGIRV